MQFHKKMKKGLWDGLIIKYIIISLGMEISKNY